MNELAALFEGWNTPVVRACLQGTMGRVDVWSGRSALASIGDFCFLGGKPVPELVAQTDAPILVPCGEGWPEQIEAVLGEQAVAFTRYATRHTPEHFDRRRLFSFTSALPQGFFMKLIDKEMYFTLMEQEWAWDLCGCFADADDFLARGLGVAVTMGGDLPVSGAASYAVCDGAIEIEIDTRPDFRRQGLAPEAGDLPRLGRPRQPVAGVGGEAGLSAGPALSSLLGGGKGAAPVAGGNKLRKNVQTAT